MGRLRAPAPRAARRNITPAPVKPQGVPVQRPPHRSRAPESPRVHHQSHSPRSTPHPHHERPACGYPLRRLRAPAPHAARRNITPAPVKPQGVPVQRPPHRSRAPESPRVHHQSHSPRSTPHPHHERPACGYPLRRLRAPAPHAARRNITPAPVKPQGVPVQRPPPPKPRSPKRPPVKRPDTQTRRPPLQGYPPAPA